MPNVIEIPEIVKEALPQPSPDTVEVTLTLNPAFVNKLTAMLSGTPTHRNQRAQQGIESLDTPEMLVDLLARQYPYIYIKALAG